MGSVVLDRSRNMEALEAQADLSEDELLDTQGELEDPGKPSASLEDALSEQPSEMLNLAHELAIRRTQHTALCNTLQTVEAELGRVMDGLHAALPDGKDFALAPTKERVRSLSMFLHSATEALEAGRVPSSRVMRNEPQVEGVEAAGSHTKAAKRLSDTNHDGEEHDQHSKGALSNIPQQGGHDEGDNRAPPTRTCEGDSDKNHEGGDIQEPLLTDREEQFLIRIFHLEEHVSILSSMLQAAQLRSADLSEMYDGALNALAASNDFNASLQANHGDSDKYMQLYEDQVSDMEQRCAELSAELEAAQQKATEADARSQEAERKAAEAKSAMSDAKAQCTVAEQQLEDTRQRCARLHAELAAQAAKHAEALAGAKVIEAEANERCLAAEQQLTAVQQRWRDLGLELGLAIKKANAAEEGIPVVVATPPAAAPPAVPECKAAA